MDLYFEEQLLAALFILRKKALRYILFGTISVKFAKSNKLHIMKKVSILLIAFMASTASLVAQSEFTVITIVESIVPGGLGRSRIIDNQTQVNAADFTTSRTEGKDSKQDDIKRSDVKVDAFDETKLVNFYSMVGINFQNIASNDAVITSKINDMLKEGWKLTFVTSGVESDAGKDDGNGIFITRLFFSK